MRNIIQAAVLLAALPASAQPVTEPRACQVTIARAPDDVRQVVEAWVRSEAQCSVALEVRIVPTEGGLYLLAQDEHGGVRERVVPDAQTAGVLVASWIADDSAPPPPAVVPPPPAPAPAAAPTYESLTPPGMAPISISATATKPAPRSKWLTVGAMFPMGPSSSFGLRGELDVWRRGKWTLGAAGSIASTETELVAYPSNGWMSMTDGKLLAYVARTSTWGRWHLRPALGAGVVYSTGSAGIYTSSQYYTLEGTFATFDASLALGRDIGKQWGAYAGLVAAVIDQRYEVMTQATDYPQSVYRGGLDLSLFAGVRHRL